MQQTPSGTPPFRPPPPPIPGFGAPNMPPPPPPPGLEQMQPPVSRPVHPPPPPPPPPGTVGPRPPFGPPGLPPLSDTLPPGIGPPGVPLPTPVSMPIRPMGGPPPLPPMPPPPPPQVSLSVSKPPPAPPGLPSVSSTTNGISTSVGEASFGPGAPGTIASSSPSISSSQSGKEITSSSAVTPLMSLQVTEPAPATKATSEPMEREEDGMGLAPVEDSENMEENSETIGVHSSTSVQNDSSMLAGSGGIYTSAREQLNSMTRPSLGLSDKLPQALEKVLAFKDRRAQEVSKAAPANISSRSNVSNLSTTQVDDDDEEEDTVAVPVEDANTIRKRREKNRKKKEKKKRSKQRRQTNKTDDTNKPLRESEKFDTYESEDEGVVVEYVSEEPPDEILSNPGLRAFRKIFERFSITEADNRAREAAAAGDVNAFGNSDSNQANIGSSNFPPHSIDDLPLKARAGFLVEENERDFGVGIGDDDEDEPPKLSKKRMKKLTRLSVAELKQLVARPDVVEMHDVCARDPKLLINLKSYRNTVPVPRHWCAKRKYLQGKRGLEKPPFDLPDFIKATGIMEMRQAVQEKEAEKSMKNKMREKVRPKTGKIDIDYQKLHDAFFRYSTKPRMTIHGDLYYEGKEFEVKLKEKKPGQLSEDLRTALGMPIGASADRFPPPWLIAMQRYGPPPSYPNLKIPGLNAPIPDGCSFGYHAGGWGKPPVDEDGRPLYGDVFGSVLGDNDDGSAMDGSEMMEGVGVGERHWGELESEEEDSSDEEEEDSGSEGEGDATAEATASGLVTPAEGLVTPSGVSSVGGMTSTVVGLETPELIELRKKTIEEKMDGAETPQLYKILPEVEVSVGEAFMGSSKVYEIPTGPTGVTSGSSKSSRKRRAEDLTNAGSEVGGRASSSSAQERSISGERERSSKKYKDFKF